MFPNTHSARFGASGPGKTDHPEEPMSHPSGRSLALALAVLAAGACDDGIAPGDTAEVTVSFVSAESQVTESADQALAVASSVARSVAMAGTNGSLTLDEIQIVVDEFKLEGEGTACEDHPEPEACGRIEADPYFLDLPLDEVPVDAAAALVADGSYFALKLETKDLTSSGLVSEVRAAFPDWPDEASLRVVGSFDPEDGSDPRPFVVYFHAEVKVEMAFDPPLELSGEDVLVVVEIDPLAWFTNPDGSVVDLSELDYEATGEVVEFEAKMSDGFSKVEIGG
jgi:hypothetical protein